MRWTCRLFGHRYTETVSFNIDPDYQVIGSAQFLVREVRRCRCGAERVFHGFGRMG